YQRFKENLENPNARQCPSCQHTQIGDPHYPSMVCSQCAALYCFYHSTAHGNEETCEAYESRMVKEDKLSQKITKNAKNCPQCRYFIEKIGGCNHMKVSCSLVFLFVLFWFFYLSFNFLIRTQHNTHKKKKKCAKCNCSFCWLCMEEIEDIPIPSHFRNGMCAGKQFETHEQISMWVLVPLGFLGIIFSIPCLILAIPFAYKIFAFIHAYMYIFLKKKRGREKKRVSIFWLLEWLAYAFYGYRTDRTCCNRFACEVYLDVLLAGMDRLIKFNLKYVHDLYFNFLFIFYMPYQQFFSINFLIKNLQKPAFWSNKTTNECYSSKQRPFCCIH
ncbi:hypothetical protein RFI_32671, partial [Reticulomyxa filosa]